MELSLYTHVAVCEARRILQADTGRSYCHHDRVFDCPVLAFNRSIRLRMVRTGSRLLDRCNSVDTFVDEFVSLIIYLDLDLTMATEKVL